MNKNKKKIIYYWACDDRSNNGEGLLARNFINLTKKNLKKYKFKSINNFSKYKEKSLFHKYVLPFIGVITLWKYHINKKKILYINFLPAWNFLLIFLLPPNTILGPVTGSIKRKKFESIIKFFSLIGLKILKYRYKKIIFSHDFYKNYLPHNKNKYFFNFLLYKFRISKKRKKKYDFVFYLRKHNNKGNNLTIKLIKRLSDKNFKICVIGEKIIFKKNIYNHGYISYKKAFNLISSSKYAVAGSENLFSFFLLDCLRNKLIVFYNKKFHLNKNIIKTNLLYPINFENYKKSENLILKKIELKKKPYIRLKNINFDNYFDN
tara:strand:+ start:6486 stop:7445 length:960 start_codon:yes stop_codon:yes gene_type:complete